MQERHRQSILDIYKLVLGGFLFVSPWLFAFPQGIGARDAWAASALIMALSLAAIVAFADWEEWLSLLLGAWLIAAPWALDFQYPAATRISIGVGIVVLYLAALELWLVHYAPDALHEDRTDGGRKQA